MRAWEEFLRGLEGTQGKETVRKWLRSLRIVRYDACNLYLEAQDAFQALWFEEHVRKKALEQLFNNNKKRIRIHLSVANAPKKGEKKAPPPQKTEKPKPKPFSLAFEELDPYCTFNTFIETPENALTFKVLCATIGYNPESGLLTPEAELASFNPIYLAGPCGAGKSHLLIACARALRERGLKALYTRAETFTDHVVSAIRAGEMLTFRQIYRNIDALLVDDVQVFSRKGATQEEFFHTFNTLHLAGKQIILSANCLPGELEAIEPRLVSRFEWGVVLNVAPLDEKGLHTMLSQHAEALDFRLNPKVAQFLIETFPSSPKAPSRALKALVLRTHLNERSAIKVPPPTTVPAVRHCLQDLIAEEGLAAITPEKITHETAAHFGITVEDILSKSQNRECVLPRQLAMYFCRSQLKLPYTKIGSHFSRDHSTVMSSVRQIEKMLAEDNKEVCHANSVILKRLR